MDIYGPVQTLHKRFKGGVRGIYLLANLPMCDRPSFLYFKMVTELLLSSQNEHLMLTYFKQISYKMRLVIMHTPLYL